VRFVAHGFVDLLPFFLFRARDLRIRLALLKMQLRAEFATTLQPLAIQAPRFISRAGS
jgi:hypothetical protein